MKNKAYTKGILSINNIELDCYVLDNEENTRVLSASSVFKAFDRPYRGNREQDPVVSVGNKRIKLPAFMASKALQPLLNQDILGRIIPIEFDVGGTKKQGYDAELLPDLCSLYLTARRHNMLTKSQLPIAEKAEILLGAFAKVGIVALIDEATGFQYSRKKDALKLLLEKYIEEGMRKWVKTFPDLFFDELDRLYKNEKTISQKRPQYYGKFINDYIYKPLEHGFVKEELNKKNIMPDGKRKARFHQWLTDFGRNQLTLQLGRIIGIMETSQDIKTFKARQKNQIEISLFSEDDFQI